VTIGYLSQHAEELGDEGSVVQAVQRQTGFITTQASRAAGELPVQRRGRRQAALGALGGERRRLSLAILVSGNANVLILDEPTITSISNLARRSRMLSGLSRARCCW